MRTENNHSSANGKVGMLTVPPGFVSLSSFSLRRSHTEGAPCTSMEDEHLCDTERSPIGSIPNILDVEEFKSNLWKRPWILDSHLIHTPKDSDSEHEMNLPLKACLPRGVIRGCSSCPNCQKVISRWRPEESHRPVLEEVPVFHPTEEEFKDTLKYVSSLHNKVKHIGMCRIVPPPSWNPPCLTGQKNVWETLKFETQVQLVNELQEQFSENKMVRAQKEVKFKRRKVQVQSSEYGCPDAFKDQCHADSCLSRTGPKLTLKSFEKYADDFKRQYFSAKDKATNSNSKLSFDQEGLVPSVDDIEGEYWRIIENPSEEIEVLHSLKSESGGPLTGFPETPPYPDYLESGWNLNNTFKLPGSLLRYENNGISASLLPQLSAGMCFSSVCWKVGEHHLYSLSYVHLGSPKIWYVVPGSYCYKFESVVKKHIPRCLEHPELLYNNVPQLSPSTLIAEEIPVYRCVQHQGEFVVIFPAAYSSQFTCGFNCSEAVSFAPFDWLPFGQHIVEIYSEQGRHTSVSVDKMLLGAATDAVIAQWHRLVLKQKLLDGIPWTTVFGEDGILTKALKLRLKHESIRRHYLCKSLQSKKMEDDFDLQIKRECSICLYDLHFSAIGCSCCPGRFACLIHGKDLCSCSWTARCLLFRYEIEDLKVLVDALEGKLYALYKCIRKLKLKMSVSSDPKKLVRIPSSTAAALSPLPPPLRSRLCDVRKVPLQQVSRRQDTGKSVDLKPSHLNSNKREPEKSVSNHSKVVVLIDDDD